MGQNVIMPLQRHYSAQLGFNTYIRESHSLIKYVAVYKSNMA